MAEPSFMAMRRQLLRKRGEKDYLRKRRDIIVAAADIFKRKGFRSTSLGDVATATGMDRATLYLYVSGKEEIFEAVVLEAAEANVVMAEQLAAGDLPVPDKLANFVRELLASYERHYPYLFVYVQEDMNQLDDGSEWSRAMRALGRRFDDAVTTMVQQGIDLGTLRVAGSDAKAIAFGIIGLCNWTHRWMDPSGKSSAGHIGQIYADMILNGLLAAKS